jgi:MFS family permease
VRPRPRDEPPPAAPNDNRATPTPIDQILPDPLAKTEAIAGRGPASVLEVSPPYAPPLLRGFLALRHRDFRLYYVGQFVSLTGTWMQSLAQSWLVLTITGSAFALGLVGAIQFLPVLFLAPLGGAIADRYHKRLVLIGTQTTQMLLALVLAILVVEGAATFDAVLIVAFLLGLANAIDMPTRQSFVVELVGGSDLPNAIALNSSLFNATRIIGPALAGLLIGIIGIAGCFFLNGLSFLAVIVGLILMNAPVVHPRRPESFGEVVEDLREGFGYVRGSATIFSLVLLTGAIGTFGMNFNVVTPIMAQTTLHVGATGLGLLMASMGVGSLAASLGLAYSAARVRPRVMVVAALVFSLFEIILAFVSSFAAALGLYALIGGAMIVYSALANSYIQLSVPNRLRGRVMSIYTSVFVGTTPIGNTLVGALAESTGAAGPLLLGGVVSLVSTVMFGRSLWSGRRLG